MEWQPIETASRDGILVLAAWNHNGEAVAVPARWRASRLNDRLFGWHLGQWSDLDIEFCLKPTHWMPLPELPTSET